VHPGCPISLPRLEASLRLRARRGHPSMRPCAACPCPLRPEDGRVLKGLPLRGLGGREASASRSCAHTRMLRKGAKAPEKSPEEFRSRLQRRWAPFAPRRSCAEPRGWRLREVVWREEILGKRRPELKTSRNAEYRHPFDRGHS